MLKKSTKTTFKALGILLHLTCLFISHSFASDTHQEKKQPNIIIFLSDDLGWKDIGSYNGPVITPTLDSLAESGMRFTNLYAGAAVC
jgi:phosphoglycerol transferase MdoB-like AlkP superfamily enzyme